MSFAVQRIPLVIWFMLLLSQIAQAQVTLTDSVSRYVIGRQVAILEDSAHQYRTLSDVLQPTVRQRFAASTQNTPNEGFSTADYWVRFDLNNRATTTRPWLLEIGFGNFSEIDLYIVSKRTGKVIRKQGGERFGDRGREISYHTYVFYLPTTPNDDQTVYIRLASTFGQATFPLFLWREDRFIQTAQVSGLLWGLYYGIFLSVFLYHLTVWLFTRERRYGLLSIYLGAYLLYELSRGYCVGARFLWPGNAWLSQHSLSTFFTITISTFLIFYSSILNLKRVAPGLQTMLYGLIGLSVAGWLLTLLGLPGVSTNLVITIVGVIVGSFIVFLGGYGWYRGYRPARYYWAAGVALFLGGLIHSLNRSGAISSADFYVHYTINLGSVLEFIFLTLGLADAMRLEKQQKAQLQRDMETKVEAAEMRGLTEERERVASEIHDNIGNLLLNLRQSLRGMREASNQDTLYEPLERMVQHTYDEVRKIANNLLPEEFEQKGLAVALQELVESLNQTHQTQFFLLVTGAENQLKPKVQFQLYLVLVELVNNVIKHAQASEASIRFSVNKDNLTIDMRDNGIGLSKTQKGSSGGRGWANIQQRLERIGGTAAVATDELVHKGTSILIRVPLLSL
ncbi:7TM diverse intracellular signaling domain-containing protein [Spirosoma montaniterrae]|uniref:histidine kinase n=1 Tax=Spirosoma montaniterrae TaxID=1178516 RepID=A0A1P9WT34_9BACT|nr:7TM diverse intracellular signaling domain-containing protein [Spirosoma montaniterrae]AQG78551.1 hypothetical protein AWR27_03860 [Spirosoma montaniterrae]